MILARAAFLSSPRLSPRSKAFLAPSVAAQGSTRLASGAGGAEAPALAWLLTLPPMGRGGPIPDEGIRALGAVVFQPKSALTFTSSPSAMRTKVTRVMFSEPASILASCVESIDMASAACSSVQPRA